jgi:predicted protein tyrosine phosphatase
LAVCGRNKRRSKTAESNCRQEVGFVVRSAGLSHKSPSQIGDSKIEWSDAFMDMEAPHQTRISGQYRHIKLPPIFVLLIEYEFEFMNEDLANMLKERIPDTIKYEM